jgi:1-acyl-sn-glycerol-3-phosphate acyltransferase
MLLQIIIFYIILCIIFISFIWIQTKKYHQFKKEDLPIHQKYYMFSRHDQKYWIFWKFLLGAILFWWIKIFLLLFSIIYCYLRLKILLWGKTLKEISEITDEKILKKISNICQLFGKLFRLSFFIRIKEKNIKLDYQKYLGENYERDESKINIVSYITNHTSLFDCACYADKIPVCFISRSNIKNYPLIGFLACCCGCIFVDRESKNNRGQSLQKVIEKQNRLYNKKDFVNICFFAEGTTSNDLSILTFKKGGFYANLPVKPCVIKFEAENNFSIAMDVIDLLYSVFLVMTLPYVDVTLIFMSSFQPNDYLYNVWGKDMIDKGKEKWEVYAEAIRDIMSFGSGLPKSNGNYQMKKEYLDFLRKGIIPK